MIYRAAIWQWMSDKEHRAALAWLGNGVAALATGAWAVFLFTQQPACPPANTEAVTFAVTSGPGSTTNIRQCEEFRIEGLSPEQYEKLAEELGVPRRHSGTSFASWNASAFRRRNWIAPCVRSRPDTKNSKRAWRR